jgi:Phage capsid family
MTLLQKRTFIIRAAEQVAGQDDTINIAISTETPFLRQDFPKKGMQAYEVLSHAPEDVDLSMVSDDGAPFCFEHDLMQQLGALKNVTLDSDGVLRADVKFSVSQQAQDIKSDMLRDIRKRISVGYQVLEMFDAGLAEDGIPVIRCKFRPYEASTVSIAADNNAGVGRNFEPTDEKSDMNEEQLKAMVDELVKARMDEIAAEHAKSEEPIAEIAKADEPVENTDAQLVNTQEAEAPVTDDEESDMKETKNGTPSAEYVKEVSELATRYNKIDALPTWLSENRTIESIKAEVLDSKTNTEKVRPPAIVIASNRSNTFGNAVKAWLVGDSSELAERGIAQMKTSGRSIDPNKLHLPTDVAMFRSAYGAGVGTGAAGVGREFLSWEDTLREQGLAAKVGVDIRSASDIISLPFWNPATTGSAVAETGSVSIGTATVGIRTWTPKRVASRIKFTNMLGVLNGTYDFEAELTNDMLKEGAEKFDRFIFAGAGGVAPTGLINDSNIGLSVISGSLSLTTANAIVSALANNNANVDSTTFVVDHDAYGFAASQGVFGAGSGKSVVEAMKEAGYNVFRTGYMPKVVAGTRGQLVAGDFSKVSAATFGALSIERDSLTQAATGETVLNLEFYMDSAARNPANLIRWSNVTYS